MAAASGDREPRRGLSGNCLCRRLPDCSALNRFSVCGRSGNKDKLVVGSLVMAMVPRWM